MALFLWLPVMKKLTVKQQRFVDCYKGNATDAARKAGYKGNDVTLGQVGAENLKKPQIKKAIQSREERRNKSHIATREERQKFWSDVLAGKIKEGKNIPKMTDRLKASELLGKSEADFVDRHKFDDPLVLEINVKETD